MRGHKPAVAEIEAAVEAQRRRVWDAEDRMEHAGRIRGWKDQTGARRVLDGARRRLAELEDEWAAAVREEVQGLREPATFRCGEGVEARMVERFEAPGVRLSNITGEQDAALGTPAPVILSGDPGDEDEHVSARRGVQIHVGLIMQYRSRFVHASPESADEFAARQRVGLLQGRLQELIDDGVLEGYKVESVEFDMLPKGA